MCGSKKAADAGKKMPDTPCDASTTGCPKPPCPDGCSKVPKIKATKVSYVVVLDKSGALWAGYPILEFEITDGCPNHYIDVQVAKKNAGLFTGGPGIAGSWDKTKLPKDRITQDAFSSWTNGETAIKLDGSGKANYKMPLDWWKDMARQPRSIFTTMKVYFKVLAFCSPTSAPVNSAVGQVDVINNLVDFKLTDGGYPVRFTGTIKNIEMKFTVNVAGTLEMYTIVQWNIGSWIRWNGATSRYGLTEDYGDQHEYNIPEWALDRLGTDPRYHDGRVKPSADLKTATATDAPTSPALGPSDTKDYMSTDWETRLHLNVDVPANVTIKRREGTLPVYKVLIGVIAAPEPLILDSANWNVRILKIRNTRTGKIDISHPATYP